MKTVEVITYSLRENQRSSDRYYEAIIISSFEPETPRRHHAALALAECFEQASIELLGTHTPDVDKFLK